MGDRCYLYVTVEKARAKEFSDIVFGFDKEPDAESDLCVSYEEFEVNWGATDERATAAKAGILFYGTHGAGDEYGPCAFYGMNGVSDEAETGPNGGYVLPADEDGNISESAQDNLKAFIRGFKEAKERIHNPLYALTQSDACT